MKSQLSFAFALCICFSLTLTNCKKVESERRPSSVEEFNITDEHSDHLEDDLESVDDLGIMDLSCTPATASQIKILNSGTAKLSRFLNQCYSAARSSTWCQQLTRPNPASVNIFKCTYGEEQPHYMIHPDERTWAYAFQAAKLVKALQAMNIRVCQIYNWWRQEPYNGNVGGAPGRHPYGTSVDVRFCSMADMEKAHTQLCKWRKQGRLRAVGYYGSTGLHLGIGDTTANTWGKACP